MIVNNLMFKKTSNIDSKSKVLLESLEPFYKIKKNKKILCDVINNKSKISLRVLDWFVSNYSKKNDTAYDIKDISFNVYFQYKARLKSFSKKLFDPFRRGEKIEIKCKEESVATTVGQLNFFKWCIEHGILSYVKDNMGDIEEDMNSIQKNNKKNKDDKTVTTSVKPKEKTKHQQLSKSVLKTMSKKNKRIIIDFN